MRCFVTTLIAFFVTVAINSQNKDDITVIYYSAKFIDNISLTDLKIIIYKNSIWTINLKFL